MELFKFLELNTILENCQSNGYAFVNPDKLFLFRKNNKRK